MIYSVIPAQAAIQFRTIWIPACAGKTAPRSRCITF